MAERSGRKAVESLLYSTDRVRILDMVTKMGEMASQALASGSPANNPRVPTQDEIVDLYRRVWSED